MHSKYLQQPALCGWTIHQIGSHDEYGSLYFVLTLWRFSKHTDDGNLLKSVFQMQISTITFTRRQGLRSSDKLFGKKGLFFQPPQKVMQQFFLGCRGLYFSPTNTIHAKNYQKTTSGVLFSLPPKMHYRASQMGQI